MSRVPKTFQMIEVLDENHIHRKRKSVLTIMSLLTERYQLLTSGYFRIYATRLSNDVPLHLISICFQYLLYPSAMIEMLHKDFVAEGVCGDPISPETLETLVAPPEIKAMLRLSRNWHLERGNEINFFKDDSIWLDKVVIFGDEELMQDWEDDHGELNCARSGWECFGQISEYDYLFVCTSPGDQFGSTRRVVNNCWEDAALTPAPFSCFLDRLSLYVEAYKATDHENEETPCLLSFYRERK